MISVIRPDRREGGEGVCDTRPTHRDEAGDDDDDEKKKREQAWLRNDLI